MKSLLKGLTLRKKIIAPVNSVTLKNQNYQVLRTGIISGAEENQIIRREKHEKDNCINFSNNFSNIMYWM